MKLSCCRKVASQEIIVDVVNASAVSLTVISCVFLKQPILRQVRHKTLMQSTN